MCSTKENTMRYQHWLTSCSSMTLAHTVAHWCVTLALHTKVAVVYCTRCSTLVLPRSTAPVLYSYAALVCSTSATHKDPMVYCTSAVHCRSILYVALVLHTVCSYGAHAHVRACAYMWVAPCTEVAVALLSQYMLHSGTGTSARTTMQHEPP